MNSEFDYAKTAALVRDALVKAGSTFREDKKEAYRKAIAREDNEKARWVLETVLANAEAAEKNNSPLCDDTGIPHLVLEAGPDAVITGRTLDAIREGVAGGLNPDSAGVEPAQSCFADVKKMFCACIL